MIDPRGEVAAHLPAAALREAVWDPAEQSWGEPDDVLEMRLVEVIAAGPRLEFEFEQLLPGGEIPTRQTRSSTRLSCVTTATPSAPARSWRA